MLTAEDKAAIAQIIEAAVAPLRDQLAEMQADNDGDEPFGPETIASVQASRAEIAAGAPMLTTDELRAKLGIQ